MKKFLSIILTLMLLLSVASLASAAPVEPSSTGDGLMELEELKKMIRLAYEDYFSDMTYEEIVKIIGVEGLDEGNSGPNSMSEYGDHKFYWLDKALPKKNGLNIQFRVKKDSDIFTPANINPFGITSDKWKSADISAILAAIACKETKIVSNKINQEIEVFAKIPVKKWEFEHRSISNKRSSKDYSIEFKAGPNLERFDLDKKDFSDINEIESLKIGDLELKGRSYTYKKKPVFEYMAALTENVALSISYNPHDLVVAEGTEASEILKSLCLKLSIDGSEKIFGTMPTADENQKETKPTKEVKPTEEAKPTKEVKPTEKPKNEQKPSSANEKPVEIKPESKYVAKTLLTGNVRLDAKSVGSLPPTVIFHDNGKLTFSLNNFTVELDWKLENGKAIADYFGTPLSFSYFENGVLMDYLGSGAFYEMEIEQ